MARKRDSRLAIGATLMILSFFTAALFVGVPYSVTSGPPSPCIQGVFFNLVSVNGGDLTITGAACTGTSQDAIGGVVVYLTLSGAGSASATVKTQPGGYFSDTMALPSGVTGQFTILGSLCPSASDCGYVGSDTFTVQTVVSVSTTEQVVNTQTLSQTGTATDPGAPDIIVGSNGCINIALGGSQAIPCPTGGKVITPDYLLLFVTAALFLSGAVISFSGVRRR